MKCFCQISEDGSKNEMFFHVLHMLFWDIKAEDY